MISVRMVITAPEFPDGIEVKDEIATDEDAARFLVGASRAIIRAMDLILRGETIKLLRSEGFVVTERGEVADADMTRFVERDCA